MKDRTWALALTSAGAFMVALDQLVVATALTRMQRDLHASLATLAWTVDAYAIVFAVLLLPASALGDRYGRRRLLMAGVALFTVASAACALATGAGALIAARAVQGAGAAFIMPLAMALLSAAYPPERRAAALGLFTGLSGLAVIVGPLVGGVLADGLGWQWIFWLNVPVGLVLVPLLRPRLSESTGGPRRLDPLGAVLVAAGVLALVWGLLRAPGGGWAAGVVAGAALLGVFLWWEARVAEPMLALRLWRSRAFAFGNAASLMLYATLTGSVFLISQYLQVAFGLSATAAGLRMLPWTATVLIAAPLSGRLIDRRGGRLPLAGGLALQAAGLLWIAHEAGRGGGYATFVAALTVAGIGVTAAMPAAQHAVFSGAGPADLGRASGTFGTLRQLGGVLGVTAMAAAFGAAGGSTTEFRSGTPAALTFAAALSAAGALCGVLAYAGRRAATVQSVGVGERAGVR